MAGEAMDWKERLALYDELVATNDKFERKGKTMPYTSANGHMFSQLNKAGEIGIRLSRADGAAFMERHQATEFRSYGAVMRGYVLVPEDVLADKELLAAYLEQSYQYVMGLPPK